ncbi:hypothetical protein A2U01_0090433, partial [Trifolium medium]|nr:hypothetical protein [Trifolium medium]
MTIVEHALKSRLRESEIALKSLQATLGTGRAQILAWPLCWARGAL